MYCYELTFDCRIDQAPYPPEAPLSGIPSL
jgi:hypothetical protein